jgi:fructose-specific component phosphotransferase system IIB-like protein
MKQLKRLALHIVLLVAAAGWAFVESDPAKNENKPLLPGEAQLWKGKASQVSFVSYTAKRKVITLEQKKDAEGAYFLGKVAPAAEDTATADKPDEKKDEADTKKPPGHPKATVKPKPVEPATFVSVRNGKKIIDKLASLRAKRSVGEVAADREAEFGLDKPAGILKVTVAGKTHELVVGRATPGSGNRYMRLVATNRVYVIDASFIRDLGAGAIRLRESTMHAWKTTDIAEVTIHNADKQRAIVRAGTEGRRFWADAADLERNDETAGNWLSKLGRLRPNGYLESLPEGASQVLRVEYRGEKKVLGFVELYKKPADPADAKAKDSYFAKSEQTRLFVVVSASVAEQVAEDVGSVVAADVAPADVAPEGSGSAAAATAAPTVAPAATSAPRSPHSPPSVHSPHSPH